MLTMHVPRGYRKSPWVSRPSGGATRRSKAEKLRDEIKKTLSLRFSNLEFVDPPPSR